MFHLFTDRQTVLMKILKLDSTQPYTVVQQYRYTGGLSVQLNSYSGHARPRNVGIAPYLYVGTLPAYYSSRTNPQGFRSNGLAMTYHNCDGNANNYFAFFARSNGQPAAHDGCENSGIIPNWRKSARNHGTKMPHAYFFFTEMHFGGCGCYSESKNWRYSTSSPAWSAAVGLR